MLDRILNRRFTVYFVSALTVIRGGLAAKLQLHPDEAYYWLWSRHLDLGYFDHAPLVAYVIRLTTLFSQTELWVRFAGFSGAAVMSVLIWVLARQMFPGERTAAAGVITFNLLPLTMSGTLIMTPDIPAFFFWAVAVAAFWQVTRTGDPRWWYATGAAFGLALLSKYTAAMLAPCLLLFLLVTDERRWLKTIHPYLAFALGAALFTPVLLWNARHAWISFTFQAGHGLAGAKPPSAMNILEYLGGQALVAGPVVWCAGLVAAVLCFRSRDKALLYLGCLSLPIIAFFGVTSVRSLAGPNWPAFAYFAFSLLAARFLIEGTRRARAVWVAGVALNLVLVGAVLAHAAFTVFPLGRWNRAWAAADATNFFHGWRELGSYIERHPDIRFAITLSHQYSPVITYYTHGRVFGWVDRERTRMSQYDFWEFPERLRDQQGVYVYLEGDGVAPYRDYFDTVGDKVSLTVMRGGFPLRKYNLIPGRGFKLRQPGRAPRS